MSTLCNLYKNAIFGIVKFLEIEYDSPVKPQSQYTDHTLVIHLRRDGIYTLDCYHELMISVSKNGIIAFSDCPYFYYIDNGHTLSLLFKNNAYDRNLSISVEGNDLGNVQFTELSNITESTQINPFMDVAPDKNIFGYISKTPTSVFKSEGSIFYIACLAYSSYTVCEQEGGIGCILQGDQTIDLTKFKLELYKKVVYSGADIIYIYKVTSKTNGTIILK